MNGFNHFSNRRRQPKDARRILIERRGYGDNWPKQRTKALERDDYTCQQCGLKSKRNHVHHVRKIKYFANTHTGEVDYEAANNLENLKVLCPKCHRIADGHAKFDTFVTF